MEKSDHVIVMDQCRVLRKGPYATVTGAEGSSRENNTDARDESEQQDSASTDDTSDAAADKKKEVNQEIKDLIQSQGDTSLYWYYFRSVGWKYGVIGLSLAMSTEVFSVMRGMSKICLLTSITANTKF